MTGARVDGAGTFLGDAVGVGPLALLEESRIDKDDGDFEVTGEAVGIGRAVGTGAALGTGTGTGTGTGAVAGTGALVETGATVGVNGAAEHTRCAGFVTSVCNEKREEKEVTQKNQSECFTRPYSVRVTEFQSRQLTKLTHPFAAPSSRTG